MKKTIKKVTKDTISQSYNLNPKANNLAIVFGPKDLFFPELSAELKKQDPNVKVVGLGTSNCFVGSSSGNGAELVVATLELNKTKVATICLPNASYESTPEVSQKLADHLMAQSTPDAPLAGVLLFAEGLNINGAALPRPFEALKVPVCGGLASEVDFAFKKTQIFYEGQELQNHITAVGFFGKDFVMESYAAHGMKPFGVFKKITKSSNNLLIEVDGKPAVDWYLSYLTDKDVGSLPKEEKAKMLAELASKALAYPIQIYPPGEREIEGCVRTPIGFNSPGTPEGSVLFTGEIPEGYSLKMMLANPQEVIDGADDAVTDIQQHADTAESLLIHLSCSARQLFLNELVSYEYSSTEDCIGSYVYGEVVTLKGQKPALLNQTFTSIKIKEAA